jgi:uncharacterized repeat protein (TIGR02543 family)
VDAYVDYFSGGVNPNVTTPVSLYSIPDGSIGDVTLTAHWDQYLYTVIYDPGTQGTWNAADETYANLHYDDPTPLFGDQSGADLDVDHNLGWTFVRWAHTRDVKLDSITIIDIYTAQWRLNVYDVSFVYVGDVPAGADALPSDMVGVAFGTSVSLPSDPADVAGFAFGGWTVSGVTVVSGAFNMPGNDVVVTGTWSQDEYTVVFAPGTGGTWSTVGETYPGLHYGDLIPVFGTNTGAPTTASHSFGYTFTGWSPVVPSAVPDASTGAITVLTYTATWWYDFPVEDEFAVTYHGNGNSGGVAPVDSHWYVDGDRVTVLGQGSLTRAGYDFLGWSTSDTAASAAFIAGSTFTIYDDVWLYAVWSSVEYTVTYAPGTHGTFTAKATGGLHYGDVTPAAPTVTGENGWNFTGWSPIPAATVTGDTTYVAQWVQVIATDPPTTSPPPTTPAPSPPGEASPTPPVTSLPEPTPTPPVSRPTEPVRVNPENVDKWALVNLILSIVGVVLTVLVTVSALLFKKKKNGGEDYGDEKFTQRRNLWLLVTLVLAIVGVVVFLVTEDVGTAMGWVDEWTIVNAIVLIVEIVAMMMVFYNKKAGTNKETN